MKIVYALTQEDEMCVCDVATIIGSTNATASHHLRMLRNMGLAEYRKKGRWFYRLVSNHVHHLMQEALQLKEKSKCDECWEKLVKMLQTTQSSVLHDGMQLLKNKS